MAVTSQGCGPAPYCRRHPEQTALYQVVRQHLETYLALAEEDDWDARAFFSPESAVVRARRLL